MVAKAKARKNTTLQSQDCTKVIGARSITRLHESYRCQIQNVDEQKKQQDDLWHSYIRDLKPFWSIPDADQEAVKESRCKRARFSEQGLLNCI